MRYWAAVLVGFWLGYSIAWAYGQQHECPSDKPNVRYVADLQSAITCNAAYRPKLVCPRDAPPRRSRSLTNPLDDGSLCWYVNDNECTQVAVRAICLSDEQLRAAQQ